MFTGIVETTGVVRSLEQDASGQDAGGQGGLKLTVEAPSMAPDFEQGASVAVNGVCLTVVDTADRVFSVEIVPETVARTTFGNLRAGDPVNLERPLRLSDRIDGHLVQGHVDGVGTHRGAGGTGQQPVVRGGNPGRSDPLRHRERVHRAGWN